MYHFIVNPNARSGLGKKVWKELEAVLKKENIQYKAYFTKYQKHATLITREITSGEDEQTVVALGGDGTVNEVVNGIVNLGKTILGYIPIGSSNDFARGLELPKEPLDALNVILTQPNLHPMNIGELRYKGKLRRFAVSAGVGFDADICHEAVVSKIKYVLNKLGLGKLTYVAIALHRLFLTTPCNMTVKLDGEKTLTYPRTYFIALMNNRFEGGGVKFAPKAQNDDDKLDVVIASDVPKIKVLLLLPLALVGWHVHFKGVYMHRVKHIDILAEKPLPLHTDGEPIFLQSELSACCASNKIRVITTKP